MSGHEVLINQVLQALDTMYSSTDKNAKQQAGQYLESFQKNFDAWSICHEILTRYDLRSTQALFAAQTLRSKIAYDLHQIPQVDARLQLKNSLILILKSAKEVKVVMTQISVALANLALQFLEWKSVVLEMVSQLGSAQDTIVCLLEFLRVLPEEISDSKHSSLTDDEFHARSSELLQSSADDVIRILLVYAQSAESKQNRELLFRCFNSWFKEISAEKIIQTPLLGLIFDALSDHDTFESAIDCICSLVRETRDVNESMNVISALYPRIIALRPMITQHHDDSEVLAGYTRLFSEAGESWHMLIARNPKDFRALVEIIAECTAYDDDLEVVQYTFYFWYTLKQMIVLDKYGEARNVLGDIFLKLINIIIGHLQYPIVSNEADLFDGDREEEEKFRSFRHEMGDVLKDCCAVVGASQALKIAYDQVIERVQAQSAGQHIPWQTIEAPLFSMRAMAREVDLDESTMLPNIMKLLVQLPEHEKIRYAATLVLGRYTEWTAKHPEFLESQLQYITGGFAFPSQVVIGAAAQALMHFCQDCGPLLTAYIDHLYPFYEKVRGELDLDSLYEVTDGIAHVVMAQPVENIQTSLEYFGKPITDRLIQISQLADSVKVQKSIADEVELLTIFVKIVSPTVPPGSSMPTANFVITLWPVITNLVQTHGSSVFVSERICKFIKSALFSCGSHIQTILGSIAELLVSGFDATHFGCYLWVSGVLVREFGPEEVDESTRQSIWRFCNRQIISFFQYLTEVKSQDVPDLIEDFFRLMNDVLMYFPLELISSDLFVPSFEAALAALTLQQKGPLTATLHYLQDLLGCGHDFPTMSFPQPIPETARQRVRAMALSQGQFLCVRILSGLIYSFPRDCVSDASALLLSAIQLVPSQESLQWVSSSIDMLPQGTVGEPEKQKLLTGISTALNSGDYKRIKTLISDFTSWYSRRNVTPRSRLTGISGIDKRFSFHR